MRTQLRQRGGFTLIELLIVIAIIGILISVILSSCGVSCESVGNDRTGADYDRGWK